MEEFELKGDNGIINIRIEEIFGYPNNTSFKGGYDCNVCIQIKVGSYFIKDSFCTSTGEFFQFYEKLNICQLELNGVANYNHYEGKLELTATYEFGKIIVNGKYQEDLDMDNILEFNFHSDQSYFKNSIEQLEQIFKKYGGLKGLKK